MHTYVMVRSVSIPSRANMLDNRKEDNMDLPKLPDTSKWTDEQWENEVYNLVSTILAVVLPPSEPSIRALESLAADARAMLRLKRILKDRLPKPEPVSEDREADLRRLRNESEPFLAPEPKLPA